MTAVEPKSPNVSVIVPARDEEFAIGACLESLALQPEVLEILVVNDHSRDRTAGIVREFQAGMPALKLLEAGELPDGWAGKNNAVWTGVQRAGGEWLLFLDADATLMNGAIAKALQTARETDAAMVSFSPEQILLRWYEKALIPFVYCRLSRRFSFEDVNNPASKVAAANGQFLLIRREAYDAIGGHAAVGGEILEDVAIAIRLKNAGYKIWFGSGSGWVRTRMYRSFRGMWQGWQKNLYRLMGGTPRSVISEIEAVVPYMTIFIFLIGLKMPIAVFLGVLLLLFRQASYGAELVRNHFPFSVIIYYIPAVVMYSLVLWQSYRSHRKGRVIWKGREYQVETPNAAK